MSRTRLSFSSYPPIEEPVVNLTPLIDVVFVILIMFIVIAPLLELDRVELADGPASSLNNSTSVNEKSPITIHVHQDNSIYLNTEKLTASDLAMKLKIAKTQHPQVNPQLFLDRKSHFGTYQTVKNAAEEAGFTSIDLLLKPL